MERGKGDIHIISFLGEGASCFRGDPGARRGNSQRFYGHQSWHGSYPPESLRAIGGEWSKDG